MTKIAVMITSMLMANMAWASADLAKRYGCVACHAPDRRVVGPSFREIAARHGPSAVPQIATSIRSGGSGRWGNIPMPAQPQVSVQDAESLARWILATK